MKSSLNPRLSIEKAIQQIEVFRSKSKEIDGIEVSASYVFLRVCASEQNLLLIKGNKVIDKYPISTALNGVGNKENSGKTPLGIHRIAEKIGADAPLGTVFKARVSTHETTPILLTNEEYSSIDAITTRVLWLDGLETGKNKGYSEDGQTLIDSYQRYIYIHGTDEEWRLGKPVSHGCIRMSNHAITKLYDKVWVNTLVVIIE